MKKFKWNNKLKKPPYDNTGFSISVLLYFPDLKSYSIGWFDFELNEWMFDEQDDNFTWTELPLPPFQIDNTQQTKYYEKTHFV